MKVICTICNLDWNASKYTIESTYICPHCQWKIDHGEKIKMNIKKACGNRQIKNNLDKAIISL